MNRRVRPSAVATRRQTQALAASVPDVVAALRAEIAAPDPPHGQPALLLMMGFPGVGKSHCARLLASRLRAAHVASDHLRSRLFVAASYAQEENAAVFRIIDGLVERLIEERHRVIVDATHLRRAARESMTDIARRRGVPLEHLLITSDEAETLARLAQRRRARAPDDRSDADERIYHGMRSRGFEEPDDPYLTLRNGPGLEGEIERVLVDLGVRWSGAI